MQLVVFSKALKDKTPGDMVELAQSFGMDGYDLAVRPGYPVNCDNVAVALPELADLFARNGLNIPMVTGNTDLLFPDQEGVKELLGAMDKADIRRLKLGYFKYDPTTQTYWDEVDKVRQALDGWESLGRDHGIKICCHTHSNRCMGLNAGMLMHLLNGFDPDCIGAYIDTGHLRVEGEEFAVAVGVVRPYLSVVAAKDMLLGRVERQGHGAAERSVVEAGHGMVDWTAVFTELKRIGFNGPVSIHCEFQAAAKELLAAIQREVAFFRRLCDGLGI
jgi:sugar phosphate isomerase/epimerase